jgi:hypothetical protein
MRGFDFFRLVNLAAFVAALVFAVYSLPRRGPHAEPLDFRLMWSAGTAARNLELSDLYTRDDNKTMNQYLSTEHHASYRFMGRSPRLIRPHQLTFTPALIASFAMLSTDNLRRDFSRFGKASKILLGVGTVALAWSFAVPGLLAFFTVWLSTIPSWSYHMTMSLGNVGALLTGAMMLSMILLRGRKPPYFALAGFFFTVLSALKPTFLYALPMLSLAMLSNRRWRDLWWFLGGCAAGGVTAIVFPYVVVGGDVTWQGWVAFVPGVTANDSWLRGGTFIGKLSRSLRLGTPPLWVAQVWSAVMNVIAFTLWYRVSRKAVNPNEAYGLDAGSVSAGILLYLLTGPVTHSHYFLQVVPAAIVAMRPRLAGNLKERSIRWALALLSLFFVGGHSLFRHWNLVRGVNHSVVTFYGVWILFFVLIYDQAVSLRTPEDLLAEVTSE